MDGFIGNIIAGLIATALCKCLSHVYRRFKQFKASLDAEPLPPKKPAPKATLRKQFFVSLILLLILWPAFFLLPANYQSFVGGLKLSCLLLAALFGLIVWGAFDAACAFYPPGDVIPEPTDRPSDDAGDH